MAVMAREHWTDESLDHLSERMDERFDKVEADIGLRFKSVDERFDKVEAETNLRFESMNERFDKVDSEMNLRFKQVGERFQGMDQRLDRMEGAIKDLHDDNKVTNRTMAQGFIALSGAIVTGCVLIAGAAAF